MKVSTTRLVVTLVFLVLGFVSVSAQEATTASSHNSEAAEGLDLHAVAELFKGSENLEAFEHSLNSHETGINNLDLDENDQVDFIRVVEQVADETHLIVLQVPLGHDEFQDVATIAVERESGEQYGLQVQGDPVIYGPDYYVVPSSANLATWGVVRWMFRPNYRPYVSPFGFGVHPRWWGVRRPVTLNLYRTRTGVFVGRKNFVATKTVRVTTVNKVNYHPRTSTLVTRRTRVTRTTTTNSVTRTRSNTTTTRTKTTVTRKKRP